MTNEQRNAKILALRGKKSFGLIARELGISRSTVAGVCFRADWPSSECVRSPNGIGPNKAGVGRHGSGRYARETFPLGVKAEMSA